jgi:hypothetical protein
MGMIRKYYDCGCVIGISTCGGTVGGCGMIYRGSGCDAKQRAAHCIETTAEKKVFRTITQFIDHLDRSGRRWKSPPSPTDTKELFAFRDGQ